MFRMSFFIRCDKRDSKGYEMEKYVVTRPSQNFITLGKTLLPNRVVLGDMNNVRCEKSSVTVMGALDEGP